MATPAARRAPQPERYEEVKQSLPLLAWTPESWARLAAQALPTFLADHASCEQQVALYALSLTSYYPEDLELVTRMAALAAEEVQHFRRVVMILKRRRLPLAGRRQNPWAKALRGHIALGREPWTKVDRLLFGALVEARSCERFTRLLSVLEDADVAALLEDLGPAEKRHWELFYRLACREMKEEAVARRWQGWLEFERELARSLGVAPTVHG
ncbi:MAG: tRNA isopentenyl-2-thiomethyl-A-37 hydroxylase MiaE [Thermoanaerobaculia bacterium]